MSDAAKATTEEGQQWDAKGYEAALAHLEQLQDRVRSLLYYALDELT